MEDCDMSASLTFILPRLKAVRPINLSRMSKRQKTNAKTQSLIDHMSNPAAEGQYESRGASAEAKTSGIASPVTAKEPQQIGSGQGEERTLSNALPAHPRTMNEYVSQFRSLG